MRHCTVVCVLVGVVTCGGVARGTLVSFRSSGVSTWSPSGAVISGQVPTLKAAETEITAEAQSKFTITTTATNDSSITWTGYTVSLDPSKPASFVAGSAGSTKFKTVQYIDAWTLTFTAPELVPHGGVVTLQFDINIPEPGPYMFTLTQNPIPEPATALFFGLGTLALLSARKQQHRV